MHGRFNILMWVVLELCISFFYIDRQQTYVSTVKLSLANTSAPFVICMITLRRVNFTANIVEYAGEFMEPWSWAR